jgi:hypothetical protein
MSSIVGFIVLILIVLLVAAFGMWAAQGIAARLGRKAPAGATPRAAAPLSGDTAISHHPSPDGFFDVVTSANEVRMSHWVETPALYDLRSQRQLFALDPQWSADAITWAADSETVTIKLRKYPGDVPGLTVAIDFPSSQATLITRGGTEHTPVAELDDWLNGYVRRFGVS